MIEIEELFLEGCANLDIGKNEEAIKIFHLILDQNPEYFEAMNKIGVAYARSKDFVNAQDCFEKALDIDQNYGPAWVNLANLYNEAGDIQTAEEFYLESIKRDVDYPLAYHNLAVLYRAKGEYERYVKNMKKYKRLYKRSLDTKDNEKGLKNRKVKKTANTILIVGTLILIFIFLNNK